LHARRRAGGTRDDTALDADLGRDLAGIDAAFARDLGDGGLIAQVVAGGLLAGRGDLEGRGTSAHGDRRTGQVALAGGLRWRRFLWLLFGTAAAEHAFELVRKRLRESRRGSEVKAGRNDGRSANSAPDHRFVTHAKSLASTSPGGAYSKAMAANPRR